MMISANTPRGESKVFNAAHVLLEETKTLFPKADEEELKRIIEAAVKEVMERES